MIILMFYICQIHKNKKSAFKMLSLKADFVLNVNF